MQLILTLEKLEQHAAEFIKHAGEKRLFAFHGEMGAGKTSFIAAVCRQLKVQDVVNSPTYAIINEYRTDKNIPVYHMDLYRLNDEAEAINAGLEDYLYSGNYCFVEWPEKAPGIFPPHTLHCYLESRGDNSRKLQINL